MANAPGNSLPWRLVAVFLLLTIGIGGAGYFYFVKQRDNIRQEKLNELTAIANLKSRQIAAWRAERLAEAESILTTSFIVSHAQRWLDSGGRDETERRALLAWMNAPRHARHYSCIFLFDQDGQLRLSSHPERAAPCTATQPAVHQAIRSARVQSLDFHTTSASEGIHLSLFVPLLANDRVIGVLGFVIDPRTFLYPLVQTWPTPSPSAETELIRREGADALFLNELRHRKGSALLLSQPLTRLDSPAVQAALGQEGVFQGRDYRGEEVLAALRKVPDSPWFMVSKIDRAEVDAPLHDRAVMVTAIAALLIGTAAFAVILLWRQQQMGFNLARHELEKAALHGANANLEERVAERTGALSETARSLEREVEQHRIAEAALKETLEDLSRSNADLEQFAYIASHDLQEPLRMVASYVQLLERRYRDRLDQDARDFIGYAVEGVTRMQRLINDMLAYSLVGIDTSGFEQTDCNEVLAEVLMNLRPLIAESHAVISQDLLPTLPASHSQLGQLFQNLLSNAIKFHRDEAPTIHVGARHEGQQWVFTVSDNGIGIAPEYFEAIFLIFKRLHSREKYAGNGIGLAICKRIVERHNGHIWVVSAPGSGSTFYFTMPETLENKS
ncbi:MAG: GHKL domain-containing protein [Sulfuricella sp.]|nr:GHKL domain-containing protein [Sulfuricella sp.]